MNTKQAQPETADKRQKFINDSGYEIRDGIIVSPGKFEGEEVFALHYYDVMMNGGSDSTVYDGDKPCDLFTISDEEREMFPELNGYTTISLIESDSGFVYCQRHEEPIEVLENLFANEED